MTSPHLSDWHLHGFIWGAGLASMLTCKTCGCLVDLNLWTTHRNTCAGPHGHLKKETP